MGVHGRMFLGLLMYTHTFSKTWMLSFSWFYFVENDYQTIVIIKIISTTPSGLLEENIFDHTTATLEKASFPRGARWFCCPKIPLYSSWLQTSNSLLFGWAQHKCLRAFSSIRFISVHVSGIYPKEILCSLWSWCREGSSRRKTGYLSAFKHS